MARIAHLTSVHNANDPRILPKQVASAVRAGYDVTLIAPGAPPHHSEISTAISFISLGELPGRYRRLLSLIRVFRVASSAGGDLYHFHDPELIPVGFFLKRRTGAKIVYDMHEDYQWHGRFEGKLIRVLERWAFTWLDSVVFANPAHSKIGTSRCPAPTVVENLHLVSEPDGTRQVPDDGRLRLVYSGVISDSRGLQVLLRLGRVIQARNLPWSLDIIGVCFVDEQRRRAEDYVRRHGLSGVVNLVGWSSYVLPAEIDERQRKAHVGLCLMDHHPRLRDVIPTKFYEYLGHGLPIVCSDIPEWKDFVDVNRCGIAVDPSDVAAVTNALERLTADIDLYDELARGARAAGGRFHWSRAEVSLLNLYRDLLSEDNSERESSAYVSAS